MLIVQGHDAAVVAGGLRRYRLARRGPAAASGAARRPDAPPRRRAEAARCTASCRSIGDLDDRRTLARLRPRRPSRCCIARRRLPTGSDDPRTRNLLAALAARADYTAALRVSLDVRRLRRLRRRARRRNAAGARADAARAPARRRRSDGCAPGRRATACALSILRVPGIYAPTRLPLERLKHGTPALAAGRRRVHEPHPRRRPRARRRRGALSRPPESRLQRRATTAR